MREPLRAAPLAARLIAGLETGVLGGVLMLSAFSLLSPLAGEPWWLLPNLLGSQLFPAALVRSGPGMITLFGAASQLCTAGLVGALSGFTHTGGRLYGLAVSFAWFAFCYGVLWRRTAPLMLVSAPEPILAVGYFVYGSTLGWHAERLRRYGSKS